MCKKKTKKVRFWVSGDGSVIYLDVMMLRTMSSVLHIASAPILVRL